MRNLFLKEVEKSKKRKEVFFDQFDFVSQNNFGLDEQLLKSEEKEQIRSVLNKLDDRLKQPLELFYFHSQSYKEIAIIMNLPIGTVMSRIARGKLHLKKEMKRIDKA